MSLDNLRVVLVRPKGSANVGSVARAMKNMGLSDLVLVQPALTDRFWSEAMAAHAEDVLRDQRTADSLLEATADCGLVVGTTAHSTQYRSATESPRQGAAEIAAAAVENRVALVFGPEDHGLSNEDLKLCHRLLCIPTHPGYASLNLAQAVMVCCYEMFLAVGDHATPAPKLAAADAAAFMFERLQQSLLTIGFLKPENPEHIMYSIRRMLGRAQMDDRDVSIWLGIARQIEWYASQPHTASPAAAVTSST